MDQSEIESQLRKIIRNALYEALREMNSNKGWAQCAACAKFQDALNRAHNFGFGVIIHETDITLVKDEGSIKIRREGGRSMHACEPFAGDTVNAHRYPAGLVEEIRHRAYQIWEEWGKCSDGALDDWLRAEAEILSHRVMRRVA